MARRRRHAASRARASWWTEEPHNWTVKPASRGARLAVVQWRPADEVPALDDLHIRPMKPFDTCPSADGLWTGLRLADEPTVNAAAIAVTQGVVRWRGPQSDVPAEFHALPRHDGGDALVTPGLVDCHTHLVYGGQRANEFAMRLAGASYEEVAKAGGGIVSQRARARARPSEDELFASAAPPRSNALLAEGVCAIEIKSGYGLSLEHERKQLRVARRAGRGLRRDGAHHLPRRACAAARIRGPQRRRTSTCVCSEMLPALAAEGLVDAVDVFCERIAFSLEETERVFQAAQRLNLPVKLHAEQLSDMGGAALAARYGALSCDHIEHLSQAGIDAMRDVGHGGRAAAGRVLHAARHDRAAHRRAARGRRADGGVDRSQPRHLAGAEPAADGEHGVHAVPADGARGASMR